MYDNNTNNTFFYIALIPAWQIGALYKKYNKCILINIYIDKLQKQTEEIQHYTDTNTHKMTLRCFEDPY